jgi:uncharacterized protein YqeY
MAGIMLEEKIFGDYKEAMKKKDTLKTSVLSFLRAEMINVATAKKQAKLQDSDTLVVIRRQIKCRQDSIEQFTKGNRLDLADKEKQELEILKSYLPPQLSEDEIKKIIEEAVSATGAQEMKDMGRLMKEVSAKIAGQADAKIVSDLVRARLEK